MYTMRTVDTPQLYTMITSTIYMMGIFHYPHGDHVDEHSLDINENPSVCTPEQHVQDMTRITSILRLWSPRRVPHGDHIDYIVDGLFTSAWWTLRQSFRNHGLIIQYEGLYNTQRLSLRVILFALF